MSAGGGVGYREGRSGLIAVVDVLVVLTELLALDDLVEVDWEVRGDDWGGSWIFSFSSLTMSLDSTLIEGDL